jgi:outer membrane putative beta-barrel porin/alpha-amylase
MDRPGRERRVLALALAGWAMAGAAGGSAGAQTASPSSSSASGRRFSVERFQLASDADGSLGVEGATIPAHLAWNLGVWLGRSDDPPVARRMEGGERVAPRVGSRLGAELGAAVALFDAAEVAVDLPLMVYRDGSSMIPGTNMTTAPLTASGVGDLRLMLKLGLYRGPRLALALVVAMTLPTASSEDYLGETSTTAAPSLAATVRVSRGARLSADVGYLGRAGHPLGTLTVDGELFARVGASLRPLARLPLQLDASVAGATSAGSPLGGADQNVLEVDAGPSYDLSPAVRIFAAGGLGLELERDHGFGSLDWRLLVGLRLSGVRAADAR